MNGLLHCTSAPGTSQVLGVYLNNVGSDNINLYPQVAATSQKLNITGSKAGNVALANLITALASIGLITDSTT
jgi:hypothetical protein